MRIMSYIAVGALVGAIVVGTVSIAARAARAQTSDGNRVDVVSSKRFDATVKALTTALKREGMMVVATIDHQNMLSMVGASIKGSKTIEFGKPDMGKMLLPMAPEVGLEMPGKIYVWERGDGKTIVSYRKVAPLYASYGDKKIAQAGMMMDMMTSKLAEAAAKR
ncbi:MAG: DUF302 domain-containing protein [Armatimonadetes bacterium]|nr:DUF302 domain-containing protein [Armatimonadota bacterium]